MLKYALYPTTPPTRLLPYCPPLALCGFWLFMMLWESNHRQLVNQWPLWLILAAEGLFLLAQCRRPIDKPARAQ